jgi:sugar lactone lactonase YvrE
LISPCSHFFLPLNASKSLLSKYSSLFSTENAAHCSLTSIFPSYRAAGAKNSQWVPAYRASISGRVFTALSGAIILPVVVCMLIGSAVQAQSAHFSALQSVVPTSSLNSPDGVAVGANGNVYVADTWHNRVLKEAPSGNTYTESVVDSNLSLPEAIAVDVNGNVYVADINGSGTNRVVKETLSSGSYSRSVIVSGSFIPSGIAVDGNGNVYIAEDDHGLVLKETPSGGGYTQSTAVNGSLVPCGIVVDADGNLYITDTFHGQLLKETLSGGTFTESVIGSGMNGPFGITLDGSGNIYVADNGNSRVLKETYSGGSYTQSVLFSDVLSLPNEIAVDATGNLFIANQGTNQILKEALSGADFGTLSVGSSSGPISMIFTFDSGSTIGAPSVVTQGALGLDFVDAGTGTCTTNGTSHTYIAGDSCTVDSTFRPKAPGARYGAALLTNGSGNVIATGYVRGTGSGPLVNFPPGVKSTLSFTSVNNPYAIAADGAGNLYLAEAVSAYNPSNAVVKETWSGSGYTQSTVATGLAYPVGVAVDGAGNVYIADQDATAILMATPSAGGYTLSTLFPSVGNVEGVAVDGSGNIYFASNALGVVKETNLNGQGYLQSTIARSVFASGIAVDAAENVYLADNSNSQALKETFLSGGYSHSVVSSGLNGPHGIAVDSNANVYVADTSGGDILKETPSGSTYVQNTIASGLNDPLGMTLDASGNVYISSDAGSAVWKLNVVDPPSLSFATTTFGATSGDSPQSSTVLNAGNAALSFPVPTSGINPSISTSFSLNSSDASACPLVDASFSTAATLAPGASCALTISFEPAEVGSISGSLVLTDNALNTSAPNYATQSILLSGTATQATPTIVWSPAAIAYGTNLSASLSATAQNGSTVVPGSFACAATLNGGTATIVTAATVLAVGNYTLTATFTPTDSVNYTSAIASVSLAVGKASPAISLTASANPVFASNPVTLTATVSFGVGVPGGMVSFYDGTTLLNQAVVASNTAAYTTSGLAIGTRSINAVYSGDANFATVTSSALTENIQDFTISVGSGGTNSATVSPGGQATYSFVVTPPSNATLPAAISFTVSGLPSGTSATFTPNSVPAKSETTSVKLTVSVPSQSSAQLLNVPFGRGPMSVAFGLLLLPLARAWRRASRRLNRMICFLLFTLAVALSVGGLTGCGGGGQHQPSTSPQSYTLTVTATSGALSHSTALTLTVE